MFALSVFGDFRLEIFSTLYRLNIRLEMFQCLSAGRGLIERFIEIDLEITRLLTECLERFMQQVELLAANLCDETRDHAQKFQEKERTHFSVFSSRSHLDMLVNSATFSCGKN